MLDLPPPEIHCISQAIYHEARGEPKEGQKAVAHVILNRYKTLHKTPCQVLKQPNQFQIKLRKSYIGKVWADVYKIASNPGVDPTRGATSFKTTWSRAKWNLKFLVRIGSHNFYK